MVRGFIFFIFFICKKSVWMMTKKRHPKLVGIIFVPINFVLKKFGREVDLSIPLQTFDKFRYISRKLTRQTIEFPRGLSEV